MSFARSCILSACALAIALGTTRANADEEPKTAEKAPSARAISVAFTANGGWVRSNERYYQPNLPSVGGQIAVTYRLSETMSVGALVSHSVLESSERLTRVAGEARYHLVHRRYVDVWGDAELGVAADYYVPPGPVYGNDGSGSGDGDASGSTRFAPLGGLGAGVDLLPLRYVSLGLEARTFGAVFSYSKEGLSGLTPGAFAGLTLAMHLPLDG